MSREMWRALVCAGLGYLTVADIAELHAVLPRLAMSKWGRA